MTQSNCSAFFLCHMALFGLKLSNDHGVSLSSAYYLFHIFGLFKLLQEIFPSVDRLLSFLLQNLKETNEPFNKEKSFIFLSLVLRILFFCSAPQDHSLARLQFSERQRCSFERPTREFFFWKVYILTKLGWYAKICFSLWPWL